MIIVDTSVLSELARTTPAKGVLAWLDSVPTAEVATTAVTAAELLYGVARLSAGRRKSRLAAVVQSLISDDFADRVEPFDGLAAQPYAMIVTERERSGRPITVADAQIAAICRVRDATLATRNTKDFEGAGIELFDPWQV